MLSLGGRRRNLNTERWIQYHAICTVVYTDEVGYCRGPTSALMLEPG